MGKIRAASAGKTHRWYLLVLKKNRAFMGQKKGVVGPPKRRDWTPQPALRRAHQVIGKSPYQKNRKGVTQGIDGMGVKRLILGKGGGYSSQRTGGRRNGGNVQGNYAGGGKLEEKEVMLSPSQG